MSTSTDMCTYTHMLLHANTCEHALIYTVDTQTTYIYIHIHNSQHIQHMHIATHTEKLLYKYLFFPNRRTRRDLRVESPLISSIWLSYKSKNINLCRLEIFWIRVIKLCWKFNKRRCSSPSMIGHTVNFCLEKNIKSIRFWVSILILLPLSNTVKEYVPASRLWEGEGKLALKRWLSS